MRDYPEWHRGRARFGVWVLRLDVPEIVARVAAARHHLDGLLLERFERQPHVTLHAAGFLVTRPEAPDEYGADQLERSARGLASACAPLGLTVEGFGSFETAPFLRVSDGNEGLDELRSRLARQSPEIAPSRFVPHVTVGHYRAAIPRSELEERFRSFPWEPIRIEPRSAWFVTYDARDQFGPLDWVREVKLEDDALP